MTELEEQIATLEAQMTTAEGCSDESLFKKHAELRKQLDAASENWLLASEELEELQKAFK